MLPNKLKLSISIFSLSILALVACSSGSSPESTEETSSASDNITVEDAEKRVREIVSLDDQELRSTILVNTDEALLSLQEIAPEPITQKAEVGDLFLVFSGTQVIYRPSTDQVVQSVPVINAIPGTDPAQPGTTSPGQPETTNSAQSETTAS